MSKKTLAKRFLEFAEEIQDPDYDTTELDSFEDSDVSDPEGVEFEVSPVSDTEATISMPPSGSLDDNGSAVTVVTPKGTSVSVTENIAKALANSKWLKVISESAVSGNKSRKINETGGSSVFFSTADVNDFYNGSTVDEIIERRIAKSWNEPQGIKNAFGGSINEDFEEDNNENSEDNDFFGDEEPDDIQESEDQELNLEDIENEPITADLSVEDDKIVIDNIELKNKVEENPSLDTPTRDEEEKDEIVIGDPIGEALQMAKKLNKCATMSGKVEDAEKPAMKVQTTNGVVDKKKVVEQPEKK